MLQIAERKLTMDSSNSPLNVTAWSLRSSVHPEDKEAADECERILNDVIAKLKPILRYVCTPQEFYGMTGPGTKPRCLLVGTYNTQFSWDEGKPVHVFLNEQGKFFQAQKEAILMAKNDDHLVVLGPYENHHRIAFTEGAKPDPGGYDPWTHLIFSELIGNLRKALAEAEEKRQQHTKAVTDRREMLDQLIAVLKSLPPAIVHAEFNGHLLCGDAAGKPISNSRLSTRPDDTDRITCEVCRVRAPQLIEAIQSTMNNLLSTNIR